ncbi:MAG: type ISP restriction/modification enzyme, partial [Thermodesulfovibrio sp.]|nr:type ISP restriction/modification enzyme [Thermodesulfovibrio sp.]
MKILEKYLDEIFKIYERGDSTEETFYSTLKDLISKWAKSKKYENIEITILPKKTEAGNPDFRVWDGALHIVGYIEAKAPTVENLDQIVTTEQIKRYLSIFPNLILTNFFEFRLYRGGSLIDRVQIGRPFLIHKLKTVPPPEKQKEFFELLEKFFSFSFPAITESKTLARELAKRTRFLRDILLEELKDRGNKELIGFYEAFKEYLIRGLTLKEFADLYSQTITYGLFAARVRSENGFSRKLAFYSIPHTIGILRDIFKFISLGDIPKQMEWIVDDISEVLASTDVKRILHQYFHEGKGSDPVIHFYETFLAEYDPEEREKRGVYYTPEPVVSYIVRSINWIIKNHFGKPDGLADHSVTVLDPAAGTLTFLAEAALLSINEFISKYGTGGKEDFIREHILKNFYAFELMMAPYAVGHLKMSFLLEEMGYKMKEDERFKFYLTNTLDMEELPETKLPGMSSLSEESHLAAEIKRKTPILVILGNPPYSVSSANKSDFIEKEMELYKEDVRSERNIQPLSDDYIKFIRFAHWKIQKEGKGIIGMITNNSYISGLIHRGMRKKLIESFDEIYILNLHGNSRIGEKSPDGSKDENVFDIQQGVAISIFVKKEKVRKECKVFYADLFGLRADKYEYLKNHDIATTAWKNLNPVEPYFFLIHKDFSMQNLYEKFLPVTEIFQFYSSGVKTHRDHFVVGFRREEVINRLRIFAGDLPDEIVKDTLKLKDTRDWNFKKAREEIKKLDWKDYIRQYSYRAFDNRYICYLPILIDRGCDRWDLMKNFFEKNIGLTTTRKTPENFGLLAFVCNSVGDIHLIGDQNYFFPLNLYQNQYEDKKLFNENPTYKKTPNIKPEIFSILAQSYKVEPTPESIFFYIYAVLYSNIYRTKYAEFLRIDFPRIPFTKDYELFRKMAELGQRLVNLHLLESPELDPPVAKFQGEGENKVEKIKYEDCK